MTKRSRISAWTAAGILVLAMILMTVSSAISSQNRIKEDREKTLRSAAQVVGSEVINAFIRPITAARVMAEDVNLKQYMKSAGTDPEGTEAGMRAYLTSLRDGLGYTMMFAVCDASGAYFTCDGISSYIDRSYKGNSAWYGAFLASGKDWDLDVDIEQSTDWALSVFVNQAVKDEQNNLLGVCGTAVEMSQLESLLERYERIYQVQIEVTDETGLIQIAADETRIENDYVTLPEPDLISDGECYYEILPDSSRTVLYMEDIDMYLVVTDTRHTAGNLLPYLKMPLIYAGVSILAAVGLMIFAYKSSSRRKRTKVLPTAE